MSMTHLRDNVAIAIDGGGIRGLVVSTALAAMEQELGGTPLIQDPKIKILAGTSTGSVIAAAIAIGMSASEIASLYHQLGQTVFPPLSPTWLPGFIRQGYEYLKILLNHSLYGNQKIIELLRQAIQEKTGNPDLTLGELNARLGPDRVLIMTSVNINERKTSFLKTYKDKYADWKLWEAILASSSAPVALPVLPHADDSGQPAYFADGGVGDYGNPAYFAMQEALLFRGYPADATTVLSFGTGWVNAQNYERANGKPTGWHGITWALRAPDLFMADTIRAQSINIMENNEYNRLDFRRFQFELEEAIEGDAYGDDATYQKMLQIGAQLGERIVANEYAPNPDPQFDPEGLYATYESYKEARLKALAISPAKRNSYG